MEKFPDSGRLINGCPGTGTTWGHGRRLPDGRVEITPEDIEHYYTQGVSAQRPVLCVSALLWVGASTSNAGEAVRAQFIILRQAFTPERIASLLAAVRRMVAKGVAQDEGPEGTPGPNLGWINRSTQFPTRTSNMLWPDKYEPEFGEWLEDVYPHLHALIDHGGAGVRNSLFGMLSSGGGLPYEQTWHRDGETEYWSTPGNWDVKRSLSYIGHGTQINAPLLPGDKFLQLQPGCHLRPSTTEELAASRYAEKLGLQPGPMPNGVTVELEPGDIVYYHSQFWHHGWNPKGPYYRDRWTLHCSWHDNRAPLWKGQAYQQEPMGQPGHIDHFPPLARILAQRYQDAKEVDLSGDEAADLGGDAIGPWTPFPSPRLIADADGRPVQELDQAALKAALERRAATATSVVAVRTAASEAAAGTPLPRL